MLFRAIYSSCVGTDPWTILCPRLATECNQLIWYKPNHPRHPNGKFDDLAVAHGLMLQACPQAFPQRTTVKLPPRPKTPPTSIEEFEERNRIYGPFGRPDLTPPPKTAAA